MLESRRTHSCAPHLTSTPTGECLNLITAAECLSRSTIAAGSVRHSWGCLRLSFLLPRCIAPAGLLSLCLWRPPVLPWASGLACVCAPLLFHYYQLAQDVPVG